MSAAPQFDRVAVYAPVNRANDRVRRYTVPVRTGARITPEIDRLGETWELVELHAAARPPRALVLAIAARHQRFAKLGRMVDEALRAAAHEAPGRPADYSPAAA